MTLSRKHYVPVIKWKQGEQKALEALSPALKESIIPVIEIPPIDWDFENEVPKKTIDEHLQNFGDTLLRCWSQGAFIDLLYIDANERMMTGQHPLAYILREARSRKNPLIPITCSIYDSHYNTEVVSANVVDELGAAIRITEKDFDSLQLTIDNLLEAIQLNPDQVDLIVDYGYADPNHIIRTSFFITGLINSIPYLNKWRNLILCGTGFPKDLSGVRADTIGQIERSEWILWKRMMQGKTAIREPIFGDYGISNPVPFEGDPRVINMSANIRYTAEDKYIIFKGKITKRFGASQYHDLADQVVQHPEYSGRNFSEGDLYIYEVSQSNDGPGNATNWRKAGTNHHLTYVASELSTLFLP
ncbi:beta family protein [Paenibacillus yanchengensis]|uniref:Beta family protein n=1 Tax=Paenibacillus yanchengensis TaxID=2035833 RepID=A0ABW4YKV0_9BACL